MNKINVKKWHNYRLCDLFKIKPAKGKNSQQLNDGNDVPYIAASKECNGFNRMVAINGFEDWVSEGNCIQLIHIGDAAAGYANYIPDKFIAMSGKSSCAYNKNMTKYSGLFIATIICKTNKNKYSFKDSWTGDKVKNTIITLPYKTNDEPDWEYMESYMRNIIQESEQKIENLRNINDYKKKVNINKWQEYRLGDLFYKCNLNKKNNLKKIFDVSLEKTDEFDLPLVNAKHYNNGIMYYGRCSDFDSEIMTLDIVQNGAAAVGDVYAQPQRTGVLEDAYLVKTYDNIASADVLLFLATVIQKDIKQHFSYDDKCIWDKAKEMTIHLPAKPNGKPDWEYMENYMKNIMQESEWNIQKLQKLDCCK